MANETTSTLTGHLNGSSAIASGEKQARMGGAAKIDQMVSEFGERAGTEFSHLTDSSRKAVQSGRQILRQNPLASVAIGLMVGAVVGAAATAAFVMRRRRS